MGVDGVVVGGVLVLAGAALLWVAWRGSQRELRRNRFVGIRVRSTMRSDAAWYSAHEAAAGPLGVGGGIACAGGIGVLATGVDDVIGVAVVTATLVGVLASIVLGTRAALRAAHAVEGPDGPQRPA